jgi:hypothetical protein
MKLTNEDLLHANLKQSFDIKKNAKKFCFQTKVAISVIDF